VLLARIDYLRRKGKETYPETREAFKAAQDLLSSYFPGWVDRSLIFVMYEANCALRLGAGISEARKVWNAALRTPLNKCALTKIAMIIHLCRNLLHGLSMRGLIPAA